MESIEELKETIELDVDEENELLFKIQIEGADQPARVRLVCESDDYSIMFDGSPTEERDVVQFLVPELKGKIKEGKNFDSRVEVLIGNKFFVPVEFGINFKQETKVFAESIQVPKRVQKSNSSSVSVSASPIIAVKKKKPQPIVQSSLHESHVKPQSIILQSKKRKPQQEQQRRSSDSLAARYHAKSKVK